MWFQEKEKSTKKGGEFIAMNDKVLFWENTPGK